MNTSSSSMVVMAPPPPPPPTTTTSSLSLSNNGYMVQYKRTRRGRVRRIVREAYLRDDIPCGFMECDYCREGLQDDDEVESAAAAAAGYSNNDNNTNAMSIEYGIPALSPHIVIIPTPRVCMNQLDWLCDSCDVDGWHLGNVVITYTALNALKHQAIGGKGSYDRLRNRCRNNTSIEQQQHQQEEEKEATTAKFSSSSSLDNSITSNFYVFANEHCRDTFVERQSEVDNDKRDIYCTVKVAQWYDNHLGIPNASLILCNDDKCKQIALDMGYNNIITCEQLCDNKLHSIYPTCSEKLALPSSATVVMNNVPDNMAEDGGYTGHYHRSVITKGLQNGTLHQGILRCSVSSWQRGKVVVVSSKNKEIHLMIKGRFNINRAVDGDVVAVEEIHTPTSTSSNDDGDDDDNVAVLPTSGAEAMEERVLEEESTTPEGGIIEKEGRVVGIIKRNWREYAGTLRPIQQEEEEQPQQGDKQHGGGMIGYSKIERIFIPANPRIPNIRIVTKHSNDLDNMRICVVMDTWDRTSRLPQGHWSRILGRCGERDTESSVILHEHNVITRDFSDDVMRCLPPKDFQPDEEEISRRLDLRNVTVCSIDPPGCKDIDDALSCEVLDNGNWRIGVHIADVTHFVHPNTAIDKEAAERCTTVYLVERRTDMLPSLLTTDLCSLVGGKDRLCFSVLWEFQLNKKNGNEEVLKIVNTQFHKAIINSNAALSYAEAQARIDDKNDNSDLTQSIRRLLKAAMIIRRKRMAGGALELASQEVRFELDSETSDPTDVAEYTMKDTNRLVEEFMLLANTSVAEQILKHFPSNSVLRRHPPPKEQQLKSLRSLLEKQGVKGFQFGSNRELSRSLNTVCNKKDDPYFNRLVRIMTTRTMNQAQYFCTGEVENGMFSHYGLAMGLYTHFTSPIRRYADILVHRLLMASLGIRPLPPQLNDKTAVTEQCDKINFRHRNAQFAGRASAELHTYLYFNKNGPCTADAVITRVRARIGGLRRGGGSLQVVVPRYGIDGVCKLDDNNKDDDEWICDEDKMIAVNDKSKITLAVFDHIQVKIMADNTDFRFKTVMTFLEKSKSNEIDTFEEAEANRKKVDKEMCPDRISRDDKPNV